MQEQTKPVLHEDARKRYLTERRTPAPGRFQHFDTPEQQAEHLRQVKEAQDSGTPF